MAPYTQTQRIILAVGTAGVAATGAIFGAQWKAENEKSKPIPLPQAQAQQQVQAHEGGKAAPAAVAEAKGPDVQALIAQRISSLETQRAQLLGQRREVLKKLDALGERRRENEVREERREKARVVLEGDGKN